MRRLHLLIGAAVVVAVVGGTALAMRAPMHRAALEQAASDYCACMLGQHGTDPAAAALGDAVDHPRDAWPERCHDLYVVADHAYGVVKTDEGLDAVDPSFESLEKYWLRDPQPTVHVAHPIHTPIAEGNLLPLPGHVEIESVKVDANSVSFGFSGLHHATAIEQAAKTCTIGLDGWSCREQSFAFEIEPGAERIEESVADGARFVDGHNRKISNALGDLIWGKSFADGRMVIVTSSEIVERRDGKTTSVPSPIHTWEHSSRVIDGWALWKDVSDKDGPYRSAPSDVMVMNLADGVRAKPVSLGKVTRPPTLGVGIDSRASFTRSYETCASDDALFVDMNPSLVVRSHDGTWALVTLTAAFAGRSLSCVGDHSTVVDYFPAVVSRCTAHGCVDRPFTLPATSDDAAAADDTFDYVLRSKYFIQFAFTTFVLERAPIGQPGAKTTIPLIVSRASRAGRLVVSGSRVLVILRDRATDGSDYLLSVDREGKVTQPAR